MKPFKVKKNVNLPVIKLGFNEPLYVQIDSEMFEGKEIKGNEERQKKGPAILMHVTDLSTGEQGQIVVATVLKGILEDNYPDAGYVGGWFMIEKHPKASGKDYCPYTVKELEPD